VRQGIVAAMNNYQFELVKSEQITIPDTYSVEFVTDAIAQAKIAKVGQADSKDPMPTGGSAKEKLDPNAQPGKDVTTRTLSITAGAPMVQVIDQLIKNSTYIEDQQLVKVLEKSGIQVPNGKPGANLAWYKISMQAIPKAYDPKRNAPAYNIKYIIHPYKVNDMISNYFKIKVFLSFIQLRKYKSFVCHKIISFLDFDNVLFEKNLLDYCNQYYLYILWSILLR
jgi:hypothetical protein